MQKTKIKFQISLLEKINSSWQKLFIYFWFFSLFGHYFEVFGTLILSSSWQPVVLTIMPLAQPYGIGVVVAILLIAPLIKKYKLTPIIVLGLSMLTSAIVEYSCAVIIVFSTGHNRFWNYSNEPFNLNGYICLQNTAIFGILNTIFLYLIYPFCENIFRRLYQYQIKIIYWILFLSYALDLFLLEIKLFASQ